MELDLGLRSKYLWETTVARAFVQRESVIESVTTNQTHSSQVNQSHSDSTRPTKSNYNPGSGSTDESAVLKFDGQSIKSNSCIQSTKEVKSVFLSILLVHESMVWNVRHLLILSLFLYS